VPVILDITDVIAGLYAAVAILAALHKKRKTGEGEYIDISLLDKGRVRTRFKDLPFTLWFRPIEGETIKRMRV